LEPFGCQLISHPLAAIGDVFTLSTPSKDVVQDRFRAFAAMGVNGR
jgi:hypothetical protein